MKYLKSINIYKLSLGVGLGALVGYGYYYFIGCNTGSCPITSSPVVSTLYGGLIGLVFVFPSKKKNVNENEEQE